MKQQLPFFLFFLTVGFILIGCEKKQTPSRDVSTDIIRHRTVGLAYLEENRLQDAESEFLALIELAPDEALGHANLGLTYLRMGRYDEAESQLLHAIKINPNDPEIYLILAQIYDLTNRKAEALSILEKSIEIDSSNTKTLYSLSQAFRQSSEPIDKQKAEDLLRKVVMQIPANAAARIELTELFLRNDKAEDAAFHMEQLRQQYSGFPKESEKFFNDALQFMLDSKSQEALTPMLIFFNFLKVTPLYQNGILELKGAWGTKVGSPIITFSQDFTKIAQDQAAILEAIRFTDVTVDVGLDSLLHNESPNSAVTIAVGDFDDDGHQDIYVGGMNSTKHYLLRNDLGKFIDVTQEAGIAHSGNDRFAIFADYNNDAKLDLFIANDVSNILYQNKGDGKFSDISQSSGIGNSSGSVTATFIDLDLEGDLDLFLGNPTFNQVYRNNLDDTFLDITPATNLAGLEVTSRDFTFGDFDEDGDIDLFVVNENTENALFTNLRQGRFSNITQESGLSGFSGGIAATSGDYDNDGFPDLFLIGTRPGEFRLFKNDSKGGFKLDQQSEQIFQSLDSVNGQDAEFLDFDNDGYLDLLIVGTVQTGETKAIKLYHNDGLGIFKELTDLLPDQVNSAQNIELMDFNEDGDIDVVLVDENGKVRLWRNDGGNANHYLKIKLIGLRRGSGKNNQFGIGAKVEVRAGDLYQMQFVSSPISHFGLGSHLKADVVRILWTNGVPQNIFFPGSDQDLIEEQTLKGSCAFLYAWDGTKYEFVTDVMWRSALGMPLGIMGGETAYAFASSSLDYFRIPGAQLQAKNGKYSIQLTEELWETAYMDQVKLIAVDHPDSVDIFIDERFLPPPVPPLRIHTAGQRHRPKTAIDDRGNDLLSLIQDKDDVYISNMIPAQFQGVTEMHDVILDLGEIHKARNATLYLNGWIFPTDASINVALSQSDRLKVVPPYLQVKDSSGNWQTVIENLSFPMGKNKTIIVDLTNKFLSDNSLVRIRTNMEIYWDYIFYTENETEVVVEQTILQPVKADLHYRGFSRLYRKGGRHGPHWFDYSDVATYQKWRDLVGTYTRYGDVQPLLLSSDDFYIIMNAGDEVTIEFDANSAPELKPGWTRDFLIYTDGWIKDGDMNTAYGKTVEPLPFHNMSSYPFGENDTYPNDKKHKEYLKKYNNRRVTIDNFREQARK